MELHTLHIAVQANKVRLLGYAYPVLFPVARFLEVAVADPRDIACVKISAIASHGMRRRGVDLYALPGSSDRTISSCSPNESLLKPDTTCIS